MRIQFISSAILLLFSCFHCCHAQKSTLYKQSSLSVEKADDILISADGTFTCGFYEVGTNAYCLSIWFTTNNSSNKVVVWTANRDSPVNGHGSSISLGRDGNFVLKDVDGTIVWDTSTSAIGVASAELLNTGNLVLKDSSHNILWQSFHSPTDTLLPTQLLTKDQRLVSGSGKGALSSGYYSLYFDNDNVLRLMYNGPEISSIYWPSPDYNIYENGRSDYNSSRIAVLDNLGYFLSSDNLGVWASDSGPGIKRRLTVDYDGNLRMYSLNQSDGSWIITYEAVPKICDVHGLCGKFGICEFSPTLRCSCPPGYEMNDSSNWNKGCKPIFKDRCTETTKFQVQFVELPNTDYYGFDFGTVFSQITFEACRNSCVQSCSCLGFGYRFTGTGACYPKTTLFNGYTSAQFPGSIFLKLPLNVSLPTLSSTGYICKSDDSEVVSGSPQQYQKSGNYAKWIYLYGFASALGGLEVIIILIGWLLMFRKSDMPKSLEEGYKMISSQFRRFTYRELKEATGKFKEELGRGASGAVFRGVLEDKRVIAVKKLTDVTQGEEEFWAEVSVIGRINHMNLVRMWGFCSEAKHRLLVYEYVQNQSLDKYLFSNNLLEWNLRFRIAIGTARGLAYLHHECLEWIIHCDIKPENILLDREFEPKIADFGLAKLSKRGDPGFNLSHIRGTMEYMAPEWAFNLPITAKVDVFSYGVLLLEIVRGSRVSSWVTENGKDVHLHRHVTELKTELATVDEGWLTKIVDQKLNCNFNYKQVITILKVAVNCLEEESSNRPTMNEVLKTLMAADEHRDSHPAYSW